MEIRKSLLPKNKANFPLTLEKSSKNLFFNNDFSLFQPLFIVRQTPTAQGER